MTLFPLLYVLELTLLPKAAHASVPETRLDVAVGLSSPYNFEEEDRAAIDWFPTVGTIYESMYVGWSVGPVGFRVGGAGCVARRPSALPRDPGLRPRYL